MWRRRKREQVQPDKLFTRKVTGVSRTVASGRGRGREAQPYSMYGEHRRPRPQRAAGSRAPHHKELIMSTIVVFSHLRWDFVFQRPQHLLSRLAQHYPVLFVEEPVYDDGAPFMERSSPAPNVTVCRAHTNIHANGFHDEQLRLLQPMVAQLAPPGEEVVAWFYTPMALPLLQALQPSLVVYDCMDELASFKNPPKQLLQRESALLSIADLVFAGGPSLYEAKKNRHPSVHCFPSSVDVVHFQQALDRERVHPQQAAIPHPRLGFYGVLDERFDPELVGEVADAHPEWQIVLAGPVVK